MFKAAGQPSARHRSGDLQQVEVRVRPEVLCLNDKALPDRQAIKPDVWQAVYLGLNTRDEAATQAQRTVEFARMTKYAHASRIKRSCDILAEVRSDGPPVPPYGDRVISPLLDSHVHAL